MWDVSNDEMGAMINARDLYDRYRMGEDEGVERLSVVSLFVMSKIFEAGWAAHQRHLRREQVRATAESFINGLKERGGDVQSWHVDEDGSLHFNLRGIPSFGVIKVPPLTEPASPEPDAVQAPPACDYRLSGTGDYRTRAGHKAHVRTVFEVARGTVEMPIGIVTAEWWPTTGRCSGCAVTDDGISHEDLDIVGLWEAPTSFMIPKAGLYRLQNGDRAEVASVSDLANGFVIHGTGNMSARWSLATGMCLTWDNSKDVVGPWEQKD